MRWMTVFGFLSLAMLGACATQAPPGPPLSSTRQILTPRGDTVSCTISTGAICAHP